jgi:hypothetical protein
MCDGNAQEPVQVVRQDVEYTMLDSGGDSNQVEKGFVYHRFVDEHDASCGVCGSHRACGEQERPVYPGSQYDPHGLKQLVRDGVRAARGGQSDELAALKEQLAELQEQMSKRGPGRPPKQPLEA